MHYVVKNIFTGTYAAVQTSGSDWEPIKWCSDINKARLYRSEKGAMTRIRYSSDGLSHPPWIPKHIRIVPVGVREKS